MQYIGQKSDVIGNHLELMFFTFLKQLSTEISVKQAMNVSQNVGYCPIYLDQALSISSDPVGMAHKLEIIVFHMISGATSQNSRIS